MGEVNRIAITGAAGFIGRATVAEARNRGLHVVAVLRGTAPDAWQDDEGITLCRCDLTDPGEALAHALQVTDAVIHAAGRLDGNGAETLRATQNLLAAMQAAQVKRLVLVSSLAVYDTMALPIGGTLTEACPLENRARDAYVGKKLQQEALCVEAARQQGFALWTLRPGAVFGPGRLWNAHIGVALGPILIQLGGAGSVPLCHVSRCAWALVQAALTPGGGTLNILDDDLPDRGRFLRGLRRSGWPKLTLRLPWQMLLPLARLDLPRLPGLLREPVLRARITPLHYDSTALHTALGDAPSAPFETLMARAIARGAP